MGRFMMQTARLSVLLGAGFSKWAAELPVVADLFDFAIEPFGVREDRMIEVVRSAKEAWDEHHPESGPEQFIAHALAGRGRIRTAVSWYIVRRLSEAYIWREWHAGRWRRHVLMIDENRKRERPGVNQACHFLVRLSHALVGILTTNYDLLVEYALGTKLFNYGRGGEVLSGRGPYPVSQWRNPVTLQGSIPLAKMHGSISWDIRGRYTGGRRALTGNALIVAPTPEKTPPATLVREWELAGHILRESTCLLVFGFSFNPYDEALLNHLQQHGCNIRHAIVVDKIPQPDRVRCIWPRAEVRMLYPPQGDRAECEDWFANLDRIMTGISH